MRSVVESLVLETLFPRHAHGSLYACHLADLHQNGAFVRQFPLPVEQTGGAIMHACFIMSSE